MRHMLTLPALALGLATVGCSFMARSPEQYRDDTRAVLDTKMPEIKACYDGHLAKNPMLSGNVAVSFVVEPETGVIKDAAVLPDRTTAPQEVTDCVMQSIQGLALDPPDAREGQATYTWEFTVGGGGSA